MLPEVMSKVAGMGPATLQAVHRFIHLMELNALVEDLKDEAKGLRIAGKLEPALLDAAVREHRQGTADAGMCGYQRDAQRLGQRLALSATFYSHYFR